MPLFVYEVRKFAGHRSGLHEAAKQIRVRDDRSEIITNVSTRRHASSSVIILLQAYPIFCLHVA